MERIINSIIRIAKFATKYFFLLASDRDEQVSTIILCHTFLQSDSVKKNFTRVATLPFDCC
jgi:hypothetical protein